MKIKPRFNYHSQFTEAYIIMTIPLISSSFLYVKLLSLVFRLCISPLSYNSPTLYAVTAIEILLLLFLYFMLTISDYYPIIYEQSLECLFSNDSGFSCYYYYWNDIGFDLIGDLKKCL